MDPAEVLYRLNRGSSQIHCVAWVNACFHGHYPGTKLWDPTGTNQALPFATGQMLHLIFASVRQLAHSPPRVYAGLCPDTVRTDLPAQEALMRRLGSRSQRVRRTI